MTRENSSHTYAQIRQLGLNSLGRRPRRWSYPRPEGTEHPGRGFCIPRWFAASPSAGGANGATCTAPARTGSHTPWPCERRWPKHTQNNRWWKHLLEGRVNRYWVRISPWEEVHLSKHQVRGWDMYLEGGGEVVFQKPELDGGFGVAKNRQHHYSKEYISALKNATCRT